MVQKTDNVLAADALAEFNQWLAQVKDPELLEELRKLKEDLSGIEDCFGGDLVFGTGGLRGILGVGPRRMNAFVVRRATAGLAEFVCNTPGGADKGVVIAYDTRHKSGEFAYLAALCLAQAGIKVLLFAVPRPTPLLSFSVRYFHAQAGIVITASHNPPEYNGYKVYWEDGGQITPRIADPLAAVIKGQAFDFSPLPIIPKLEDGMELAGGLIRLIDQEAVKAYFTEFAKHPLLSLVTRGEDDEPTMVYTALNGTGGPMVVPCLTEHGFCNIRTVSEQMAADPDFTTVGNSPNPENPTACARALELAQAEAAGMIFATDPDGDRVGVMVREGDGWFRLLNGNELGLLLLDYVLEMMDTRGITPQDAFMVTTVVTGDAGRRLVEKRKIPWYETLTGFKYICEKAGKVHDGGKGTFIFGYEESGGYVAAPFVRDKDGVMGSLLVCQMFRYLQQAGTNALERLEAIYREIGYFSDILLNFDAAAGEGYSKVRQLLDAWRLAPPLAIGGFALTEKTDYLQDETGMVKEDVLKLYLGEAGWLAMRPSGTEPKMKVYICGYGNNGEEAKARAEQMAESFT